MQRRSFLRGAGLVAAAGLAGCGGDGQTTTAEPNTVAMVSDGGDFFFDPVGLFVEPGTTVTWRNEAGRHSTTAYAPAAGPAGARRIPDGAEGWNSDVLAAAGETFEFTFETPGTYDYFCIPHKSLGMVGRVVVGEPGGPAEGSTPPDGDVPDSQSIVESGAVSYDEFSG